MNLQRTIHKWNVSRLNNSHQQWAVLQSARIVPSRSQIAERVIGTATSYTNEHALTQLCERAVQHNVGEIWTNGLNLEEVQHNRVLNTDKQRDLYWGNFSNELTTWENNKSIRYVHLSLRLNTNILELLIWIWEKHSFSIQRK